MNEENVVFSQEDFEEEIEKLKGKINPKNLSLSDIQ